jgi:hypothetical protein
VLARRVRDLVSSKLLMSEHVSLSVRLAQLFCNRPVQRPEAVSPVEWKAG